MKGWLYTLEVTIWQCSADVRKDTIIRHLKGNLEKQLGTTRQRTSKGIKNT